MKYEHVDITKIKLDPHNPRIAHQLGAKEFDSIQDQNNYIANYLRGDTGNTENGPSCLELEKSIYASRGIIEPVILLKQANDTYVCIEGNTRLSIYISFANDQFPEDNEWKRIPSLIHEKLDQSSIDELRLQAHFVGKKEWTPYAKGRYITELVNTGTTLENIKKIVGGSDSKTRANYYAYKVFKKEYEPLFSPEKDNIWPEKNKFSMFATVPDGGKHAIALESRNLSMSDFAQWVKEDKVGSANDVRRFLDKVLLDDNAFNEFQKKGNTLPDVVHMLPSDSNLNQVSIKDASISQLCDVLNDTLLGQRKNGTLKSIINQEGPGVIDSINLLKIELDSSLDILEED